MNNTTERYEEIKRNAGRIATDILTLTRNGLFVTLRFLDVALCQFSFISDDGVNKLSTTGETLLFNTKYVISNYIKEKQVLSRDYLHIVLHCIFRHPFVSDKLNREYWDLAADIAVEGIISDLDVKQANTDDYQDIQDAIKILGEKIGKLTAERIYSFLIGGGLSTNEIRKYKGLFFRDEHDIWWEIARKLREQAEKEAEQSKAESEELYSEPEDTRDKEDNEDEEDFEDTDEAPNDQEHEEANETADDSDDDDQDPEVTQEDIQESVNEEDEDNEKVSDEQQSDENDDFDDNDDDDIIQMSSESEASDDDEGDQPDGTQDPEGGESLDKKDHDGTKDDTGETNEDKDDAESGQNADGRTGSGENRGVEESKEPDEGGAMKEGAQEPKPGNIPEENQPDRGNKGSQKKNASAQQDQNKSGGEGGGDSTQAAWQHQSSGGSKKGAGGGDSEIRDDLEGNYETRGSGDDVGEIDDKGRVSKADSDAGDEASKYNEDSIDQLEKKWKEISERLLVDLETSSREWGDKSDSMLQSLKNINRDRYDYEAFLRKFAVFKEDIQINPDEFDYVYYTYGLERYGNMPLVEPLEYREVKKIHDFVIAIDTSGSCSGEVVQKFLDKTYSILMQQESFFKKINLHIIQCDAQIQEVAKITDREEFDEYIKNLEFKGFGGTDFRPVFEYVNYLIEQKEFMDLKGLIYFTDGNGTYPLKRPKYDTAFVFVDDREFEYEVPSWAIKLVLETRDILEEDKVKI